MENLLEFIKSVDTVWIYVILLAASYTENIIPPVPGDTVVIFGAYLVGTGTLHFEPVFMVTTLGSLAGFLTIYGVGRLFGIKVVESKKWSFFSSDVFVRVDAWFEKYGFAVIAANRFLSGARSLISLFAGVTHLNIKKVSFLALASCAVWNFILIYAGSKVGENWESIVEYVKGYNMVVFGLVAVVFVIVIARWYKVREI